MDKDTFILMYLALHEQYGANSPFMVHMRIATHGDVKLETTHPFRVEHAEGDGEFIFCHNGIIHSMDKFTDDDTSDTMAYADIVLKLLPYNWQEQKEFVDMIEHHIGWSKFVIITTHPEATEQMTIINEGSGNWIEDTWFSNNSCEPYVPQAKKTQSIAYDWNEWSPVLQHQVKQGRLVDKSFDHWLQDGDEEGAVLFTPEEIVYSTDQEKLEMLAYAKEQRITCTDCYGVEYCFCADKCSECYYMYHTCECDGKFVSLHDITSNVTWIEEGKVVPF